MSKRDNQLSLPLDKETRDRIEEEAEKLGLSKAGYARMKLKEAVE